MMSLSDAGSDLRWVVTNLTFQSSEMQSSRLKHISLPVCPNRPVRDAYKSALTGMFGKCSLYLYMCLCVCKRCGLCAHVSVYVCACMLVYLCVCEYMCIYTCWYVCICMYMCVCFISLAYIISGSCSEGSTQ